MTPVARLANARRQETQTDDAEAAARARDGDLDAFEVLRHAQVRVGDAPGVWIDGPHELIVVDRTGEIRVERPRLAARTLVWQRDGVTLRLEGDFTLAQAIAVATGMR